MSRLADQRVETVATVMGLKAINAVKVYQCPNGGCDLADYIAASEEKPGLGGSLAAGVAAGE